MAMRPVSPFFLPRRTALRASLWGAFSASWLGGSAAEAREPAGKVEALRGEAFVQAASRRALMQAGDIFVGDTVATGANSAVALRFGAATLVRLGADTELRIDRFIVNAGGILELARGAMVFDRDEAAPKTDISIRSPFGLIAVRGTRFFAGPSNDVFGVFVERGNVKVVAGGSAFSLTATLGTDIAKPGDSPTEPHVWNASRIQRAFASAE